MNEEGAAYTNQPSVVDPSYATSAPASSDGAVRRVCDQCRKRKVRCDRDWPCFNCRTAKQTCTFICVGRKPKEPRQRVLISSQYERKIDNIENRLADIEALLRELAQSSLLTPGSNKNLAITPAHAHSMETPSVTVNHESSDDESAFGGDSVIAKQTSYASEFLEHAMKHISLHDISPEMLEALDKLKQMAEHQSRQSISHGPRFPFQQLLPKEGLGQLRMAPMDVVFSLLNRVKASPPCLFSFVCSFSRIDDFYNLCQTVYFPTPEFSNSTFIIVNIGLYYLFLEQHTLATDNKALKDEFALYIYICQTNLETALANIPLFMAAKVKTVQALLMGTIYAIDMCRPSVAWQLNSAAAQICQTAGFHRRDSTMCNTTDTDLKATLFWQIYSTDRALAIRLGRAPVIQDWKIAIPRSFHFKGLLSNESKAVALIWLSAATLQGQVYEQLFSPAALTRPQVELIETARSLAAKCRQIEAEAYESRELVIASLEKIGASPLVDIYIKGDEVQLLSIMTFIYRAIPPLEGSTSSFGDECIETARRATRKHLACMELVHEDAYAKTIYVHRNLLLVPFAPFFVLFCYVIETLSVGDLRLLQEFSASIKESVDSSESMQKLSRLCDVMGNVATLYFELKSQQREYQEMIPIGDEFDIYLGQLGFIPMTDETMNTDPNALFREETHLAQMTDWMFGSRNLFGLLEQDLSQGG